MYNVKHKQNKSLIREVINTKQNISGFWTTADGKFRFLKFITEVAVLIQELIWPAKQAESPEIGR